VSRESIGYGLAFASAVAGAARYNLAVFADLRGLEYAPFLALSLAVGLACSLVHVLVRDGPAGLWPGRRTLAALVYGALMAWSTLCHFLALRYLNETVMASLSQTSVLLTIALAVWLLGERFTRQQWIATFVICAGVFAFRPWDTANLHGFLIVMSGVVGNALATVGAKRWVVGTPPRVLMVWRNAVALVVVTAYALTQEPPELTPATVAACVSAGVLGPYLHGLFFLQALERIDAAKASLTNRMQPAIVFVISWALLARSPDGKQLASAILLVAGVIWLATATGRSAASRR